MAAAFSSCRLIRYFDEESEESWKITPAQVYLACILLGGFFYLVNQGVVQAIWNLFQLRELNQHDSMVVFCHATSHFQRR